MEVVGAGEVSTAVRETGEAAAGVMAAAMGVAMAAVVAELWGVSQVETWGGLVARV